MKASVTEVNQCVSVVLKALRLSQSKMLVPFACNWIAEMRGRKQSAAAKRA